MSYVTQKGDTLSALYKKLGYSTWQDLYNANKDVIGSNPNLIYAGQTYKSANETGGGTSGGTNTQTPPSQTIANSAADNVIQRDQNFIQKYGSLEDLMPTAMFSAVGEQMNNPSQLRAADTTMRNLDWKNGLLDPYGSGALNSQRESTAAGLEQARKEAVNTYIQAQQQQFTNWYQKEMKNYETTNAPDTYTLSKYGIDNGGSLPYNSGTDQTKYSYTPAFDLQNLFKYGGYSTPTSMYNLPTAIG